MATVLPAVFVLGLFTVVRLVDALVEYNRFLAGIARVREQYRVLSPEAAAFFAAEHGRWPEEGGTPALGLGAFIAFIDGQHGRLRQQRRRRRRYRPPGRLLLRERTGLAVALGALAAALLMGAFLAYQRWRHGMVRHPRGSRKHALDRGLPLWGPSSAASCSYNHRYRSVPIPYRRRSPQPVEIVRSTLGHWPR